MSLVLTRTQNMRAMSDLDKWEYRASRYGALDLFLQDTANPTGIVSSELVQKAVNSVHSTLQVPVIDFDGSVSIGSSRSVTIADDENTSALQTISFTTYAWGFTMVPAAYMNNEIGYQKDFETKFRKYLLQFLSTLDSAGITALDAAKTQVLNDDLASKYSLTSNVLVAALADQDEVIGDISVLMEANDYYDQLHVVGGSSLQSHIRNRLLEKGQFNQEQKQYQYNDKVFHFSNRVTDAASQKATGYAVTKGSVGMVTRFEREALRRASSRTGHEWDIITIPGMTVTSEAEGGNTSRTFPFNVGTYYYESVGDYNAIAGAATADLDRAVKEHYGFAVDVAFITSYNSDNTTYPSPILKFSIATV